MRANHSLAYNVYPSYTPKQPHRVCYPMKTQFSSGYLHFNVVVQEASQLKIKKAIDNSFIFPRFRPLKRVTKERLRVRRIIENSKEERDKTAEPMNNSGGHHGNKRGSMGQIGY